MAETTKKRESLTHRLYTGRLGYDFIKNRRKWFIFTLVTVVLTILVLAVKQLTLGIEFRGGTDFQAPVSVKPNTVDVVRAEVKKYSVKDLNAQVFAIGDSAVRIQTRSLTPQETNSVQAEIAKTVNANVKDVTYNTIGGSWGAKISREAGTAVAVFLVLVMVLIAVYFRDWRMALAAILGLAHDMLITLGVYSLVGFTVTPPTLIGILTILGYSLYNTVVVFDKVRENVKDVERTSKTYASQANLAINQVLMRSINTTVFGVLPVFAMFIAGLIGNSGPLKDLGLALMVGIIAGLFSSIFLATPLLVWFKERDRTIREHNKELARRQKRAAQRRTDEVSEPTQQSTDAAEENNSSVTNVALVRVERRQRRTHSTRSQRKGKK